MGLITSILIGSMVMGAVQARNQRKDAARAMKKQETAAREAAALDKTQATTGAEIDVGTEAPEGEVLATSRPKLGKRSAAVNPIARGVYTGGLR